MFLTRVLIFRKKVISTVVWFVVQTEITIKGYYNLTVCFMFISIYLKVLFFFLPNAPHVLVDFAVFPPGHGRSVTDF